MSEETVTDSRVRVRIGFLATYRFGFSEWCRQMYDAGRAALAQTAGVDVVAPPVSGEGDCLTAAGGAVPYGAVHSLAEAEVVADFFTAEHIDGLLILPLDFGDERAVAKVAERLRVPTLLCATKEPPARDDASRARVSDSYCGTLSIASGLRRRGLRFHYAGLFLPDEPAFADALDSFARACAVAAGLRGARLGQVGVRPPTFETVGYNETALIRKFGQNVIFRDVGALADAARAYADDAPEVVELAAATRAAVDEVTVSDAYLRRSAKLELALVEFWNAERLSALAMQCWPTIHRLMNIEVCSVYGRLTQRHMLTACETDILGALSMLIQYRAALATTLPHFVDWTIRHRTEDNVFLAWHCGNAPVSLAAPGAKTALRARGDMTGERACRADQRGQGLWQFQLKPGKVTLCRLAEYDGDWKLLIAPGEIVPSDETLAGTWSWVKVPDHDRLYRTLVEEGFIHHASMIHGDQVDVLVQACGFLEIRPIVVG